MSKRKKHTKGPRLGIKSTGFILVLAILATLVGVLYKFFPEHFDFIFGEGDLPEESVTVDGNVEFHFIDVGQGDGALIRTPDGDVVVDAGPSSTEDEFVDYLRSKGVTTIEYLVLTHPHSDHIGGADAVLEAFDVKRVILPETDCTTSVYRKVVGLIEKEKSEVIISKVREVYSLGDFKMTILAPNGIGYDGYNDYSVVLRAEYGSTSVLLTGDAEKVSEQEMLEQIPLDLIDCDLLKVGHHGSHTSTTKKFFNIVSPDYAVISLAKDNEYGHPHKETSETLAKLEAEGRLYRTDISGSVIFTTNGSEFTVTCEK